MDNSVFKISDQVNMVNEEYRHVVVLGAGASKASCIDKAEMSGKQIPLMNDLHKVIDLKTELSDLPIDLQNENFEVIFSTLYDKDPNSDILRTIEKKIYDYFSSLKLPDTPTIYDHLILSLRKKDLIATFNWDPFLWQAFERNLSFTDNLPQLAFLHGNVAIGFDKDTKTFGPNGYLNLKTKKTFQPTRLFYPIKHKNYNSDPYIKNQWNQLSMFLKNPARVTIFGYSAPKTDVEAISIMKTAWGLPERNHLFTQFEIIDIKPKCELTKSWKDFIFSHHYEVTNNFFKSSIMRFPRRTGEVFLANYLEGKWYQENYPPKFKNFKDMKTWYSTLIDSEQKPG
ncbi:MAG: hypothetical protein M0R21_09370 [Lentimicrobiaceae bacterium]|nr:hypothetical protein [Lentimicrobiaceae bacterium]